LKSGQIHRNFADLETFRASENKKITAISLLFKILIFTLVNLKTWVGCRLSNYDTVVELYRCFWLGNFVWLLFPKLDNIFSNAGQPVTLPTGKSLTKFI
jgi:hypothetical protein